MLRDASNKIFTRFSFRIPIVPPNPLKVANVVLVCLTGAVALVGAILLSASGFGATEAVWAASAPATIARAEAETVTPDRISFYNVPVDHKLESQIDYADGRTEKIKYPAAFCAAGTVITQPLNLYTATFIAQGCETTVYQQFNLRWLGGCRFKFEDDPNARVIARGPYGETVIAEGHYSAGELEWPNLPANTTSLSATMSYTNAQGNTLTGNVEFSFREPHPGCGQVLPTVTPTATSTATPNVIPTATPTAIVSPVSSSPTPTPTPTMTATETPTVTPTATQVLSPTGLDPVDEPGSALPWSVYLPFMTKSAGGS
ncbi:MAG: hypothetical protein DYG89_03785 [Caldilinea sp. CFX5]|nr:hypothetical protein [Caldilinea sp. CFX5]